jgi:hypothetical protein
VSVGFAEEVGVQPQHDLGGSVRWSRGRSVRMWNWNVLWSFDLDVRIPGQPSYGARVAKSYRSTAAILQLIMGMCNLPPSRQIGQSEGIWT